MFSQSLHILNNPDKNIALFGDEKESDNATLIKTLYEKFLKQDPLFHFLYDPNLTIRITSEKILQEVVEYLNSCHIPCSTEPYPKQGEISDDFVLKNLNLFLPIYHAHSIAALSLYPDEHIIYMEKVIHGMCNPFMYTNEEEGHYLALLAEDKLGQPLLESHVAIETHSFVPAHHFSYEHMVKNHSAAASQVVGKLVYECEFKDNWLTLTTMKGVEYDKAKHVLNHLTPDWKLHFSIPRVSLPKAWNILGNLFIEMQCKTSLKMRLLQEEKDETQGHEISIDIYQHEKIYEVLSKNILTKQDQERPSYWLEFIEKAEQRLLDAAVKKQSLALGDKALGKYASLRNECYIEVGEGFEHPANTVEIAGKEFCYPPASADFNATHDANPLVRRPICSSLFQHCHKHLYEEEIQLAIDLELSKRKQQVEKRAEII